MLSISWHVLLPAKRETHNLRYYGEVYGCILSCQLKSHVFKNVPTHIVGEREKKRQKHLSQNLYVTRQQTYKYEKKSPPFAITTTFGYAHVYETTRTWARTWTKAYKGNDFNKFTTKFKWKSIYCNDMTWHGGKFLYYNVKNKNWQQKS